MGNPFDAAESDVDNKLNSSECEADDDLEYGGMTGDLEYDSHKKNQRHLFAH